MSAPWLFLAVALVGAWFTYNAFRPHYRHPRLSVVSFFAGWLTTELAFHHLAWQVLVTAVWVWFGALGDWPGWVGLGIPLVSWLGLARLLRGATTAETVVEKALGEGLGVDYQKDIRPEVLDQFAPGVDWRQILMPFPMWHPEVERLRDVVYAQVDGFKLKLDVYRHRSRPKNAPILLQIHGGAWVLGSKNEQGIPLMLQPASRGWVCVAINYRLSPRATFPAQLVDVKRAIAWIRRHADEYGANPDFLVVTGGSAGGHLCALTALTANDPEYQPEFAEVDTSVRACVAFYGVYDFADRHGHYYHPGFAKLLSKHVMKVHPQKDPAAYDRASPLARITTGAPPFFVIHGDRDTLVPVGVARQFVQTLREHSRAPVVYAEIPGAQHAFDIFPSLRATFVIHGVERFLAWAYSRYLTAGGRQTRAGIAAAG